MNTYIADWTREVVSVMTCSPGLPQLNALVSWLKRLAETDNFVIFIYEGNYRPFDLFDTFPAELRSRFVSDYQTGPYLLDPFYLAVCQPLTEGVYSMRRLAPDHFYSSEYFLNYYHNLGLSEEIGFFIELSKTTHAVLSLMRKVESPPYSKDETIRLESTLSLVHATIYKTWKESRQLNSRPIEDRDHLLQEAFINFGRGVLTGRECEVSRLLLKGHSNQSVAKCLGISAGTVKVHRKNLYEKLGIGSQSELLALFIEKIKSSSNS